MNVMSVECENACFKVEHGLVCTNCPGFMVLSRVPRIADTGIAIEVKSVVTYSKFV